MEIYTPLSNASIDALAGDPCATLAPRTAVWGAVMRERAVVVTRVLDGSVAMGIAAPKQTVLGTGHAFTGFAPGFHAWSPPL